MEERISEKYSGVLHKVNNGESIKKALRSSSTERSSFYKRRWALELKQLDPFLYDTMVLKHSSKEALSL